MKKNYLLTVVSALCLLIPQWSSAQVDNPLAESFEEGIPKTWIQEYDGNYRMEWFVEKGDTAKYPTGAVDGKMRVAFRNTAGVEYKTRARLISPVFDPTELVNPIVSFSHAAARWNGNFDTLYVKYRNVGVNDDRWLDLARFTSHSNTWTRDTVDLVSPTEKYQIAFEAVDHLGRGIVLDNIVVTSNIECEKPSALLCDELSVNDARLSWSGGFAQDGFQIKVSTTPLRDYELADADSKADILDIQLAGDVYEYKVTGLKQGAHYYWYMRTLCGDGYTEWVTGKEFATPNTIASEFTLDFNTVTEGQASHPEFWYWGNSFGGNVPFINGQMDEWYLGDWSNDETYALIFGIANRRGTDFSELDAGAWAYIASPEILTENIAMLQVAFDAVVPWSGQEITVGVMTNPTDFTTFTAIETVKLSGSKRYTVSLASYEGSAKHIALASNSESENVVAIDNLEVSETPLCPRAAGVTAVFPSATEAVISWNGYGKADGGQILVAEGRIYDEDMENAENVVAKFDATSIPYSISGEKIEAGKSYYVYVRSKCGEAYSEWCSQPLMITMPDVVTELPQSNLKTLRVGEFTVLPELVGIDIKTVEVKYLAGGMVSVGVMDTVGSITSYRRVGGSSGSMSVKSVTLDTYTGKGRFIAIQGNVSDIKLGVKSTCAMPEDIVVTPGDVYADFAWTAGDAAKWEVRVSRTDAYSSLDDAEYQWFKSETVSGTPELKITGLESGKKTYYYYMRTVCDADPENITYSDWTYTASFATECPAVNSLPYELDFATMSPSRDFENTCFKAKRANNSPEIGNKYIDGGSKQCLNFQVNSRNVSSGDLYVVFGQMNIDDVSKLMLTLTVVNTGGTYNPEFLNAIMEVGVMSEFENYDTFEPYETLKSTELGKWEEFVVAFSDYKGTGKYIALRVPKMTNNDSQFSISKLSVKENTGCAKASAPIVNEVASDAVTVSWRKGLASKWDVLVSDEYLAESYLIQAEQKAAESGWPVTVQVPVGKEWQTVDGEYVQVDVYGDATVFGINENVIENNGYKYTGLESSSSYYVYVRSVCDEGAKGEWSVPASFSTPCAVKTPAEMGVITFEVDRADYNSAKKATFPECWTCLNSGTSKDWVPLIRDEYAYEGEFALKIGTEATATNNMGAYAIMPEIDIDDISKLEMTFYGAAGEVDYNVMSNYQERCMQPVLPRIGRIIVGVITNPSDLSTVKGIDTIQGYKDWQKYTVRFDKYIGDDYGNKGKNVVFISEFNQNNVFYIDNISLRDITADACTAPVNIEFEELGADFANIAWEAGTAPFTVKLADRQLSDAELGSATALKGVTSVASVTETGYNFTGLKPNATYYVYVGCSCDGVMQWSAPERFMTDCAAKQNLPFREDFDAYTPGFGVVPNCWVGIHESNQQYNPYPYINEQGRNRNGLYVYSSSGSWNPYAVTPEINAPITECRLDVDVKGDIDNWQRSLVVGVVTDMTSDVTIKQSFIAVDTVVVKGDKYEHFTFTFENTTPSAKAIVFTSSNADNANPNKQGALGWTAGVFIDNVEITSASSCAKPETVTVVSVDGNKADLHIDGQSTEYGIIVVTEGSAPDMASIRKVTADCTIDITESVDVYVYGASGDKYSDFSYGPVTVRATGDVVDTKNGWTETFEAETSAWTIVADGQANTWSVGAATHNGEASTKALYVTKDNGVTAGYDTEIASKAWAYRTVQLAPGFYTFTFDWAGNGETGKDFMRVGLLPVESTFKSGSGNVMSASGVEQVLDAANSPEDWISLDGGAALGNSAAWTSAATQFTVTEEMAGKYNMVAYWENNNANGEQPSAAIDNIEVAYEPCVAPLNLAARHLTHNAADLSWEFVKIEGLTTKGFEVFVTADVAPGVTPETADADLFKKNYTGITESNTTITGLPGHTPLAVFVRTICSDEPDGNSIWSDKIFIETLCDPHAADVVYDFEDGGLLSAECIVRGHLNPEGSAAYAPEISTGGSYGIARSGNAALALNGTGGIQSTYSGGYAALPLIDGDLDGKQLTFYMRALCATGTNDDEIFYSSGYLDPTQNARVITVGTMTDPNDASTFEEIKLCQYPYSLNELPDGTKLSDDPNKNNYWVKFSIPLKGYTGKYITFLNPEHQARANKVFIDDVIIEDLSTCQPPEAAVVEKITSDSVVLSFKHAMGEKWLVEISDQKNMSSLVTSKETESDVVSISGLKPNTRYYVGIRQICEGEATSDLSIVTSFMTSYGLKYQETFAGTGKVPADWRFTNGVAYIDQILDGQKTMSDCYRESGFEDMGWVHRELDENFSAHEVMSVSGSVMGSGNGYWMMTPEIYIRKGDKANLSLDVAVTQTGSVDPLLDSEMSADGMSFVVAVSEDKGVTWKRENAYFWNNSEDNPGVYKFGDLTNKFKRYTLDFSRYMDQNIMVGFAADARINDVEVDIHIDNLIVNTMEIINVDTTVCGNEDFVAYGFDIPYEKFRTGLIYKAERYGYSVAGADTLYKLNIAVSEAQVVTEEAEICEGSVYSENGFFATEAGRYVKHTKVDGGCYATTVLDLTVIPSKRFDIHDVICRGAAYDFNGKALTRPGVYLDTVPSTVAPYCDSVIVLTLEVLPVKEHKDTVYRCFGETYLFGDKELAVTGDYDYTFKSGECDSVVYLHFVVEPEYIDVKEVVICDGETYNDDVFKGIKSNFSDTLTRKSVHGCDSLVGLNLVVIKDGETVEVTRSITLDDLPFDYHGHLFDANTAEGVHTADVPVKSQSGECAGTIHLTLYVNYEPMGNGTVDADSRIMTLTPNPVKAGEQITIDVDLTDAERNGAMVEVYNAAGVKTYSFETDGMNPITMSCNFAPGVYVVRLTDGTGKTYYGKVIVR